MNEYNQSTVKRKEALKKQLFEYFGYDKKLFIDEELTQVDFLLSQGYDFQEVFTLLKNSIQTRLSKSPSSYYSKSPAPESNRSYSTDKTQLSRYSLLNPPKHRKKVESWQEYTEQHKRFNQEFSKINSNLEKAQINSYRKTPTLEYQSKMDEVKALEAFKLRELQAQEIEFKKRLNQIVAERENVNHLNKQILDKRSQRSKLRLENKYYRDEIEDRSNYLKIIEQSERERKNIEREVYNQALNEQLVNKNKDKVRMQELDKYSKQLASDKSYPESELSVQSGSSSILPGSSPLKFLVQYGNYVPIKHSLIRKQHK